MAFVRRESLTLLIPIAAILLLALAAGMLAASAVETRVRASIVAQTGNDALLRAALLDSELARYRLLPVALADDRDVAAAGTTPEPDGGPLDRKLEAMARVTGAPVIYVVAPDGRAIASSNWRTPQSFVGTDFRFRAYFQDAVARGESSQFALGLLSGRPGLYIARRTTDGRVIVIKLEFDGLEAQWRRAGGVTYVTDTHGVVLVASRPDWRFAAARSLSPADAARYRKDMRVPADAFAALPLSIGRAPDQVMLAGREYVRRTAATSQPGWTVAVMREAGPTITLARRTAGIGAALAVIVLAAIMWTLRRRGIRARLRTAELEQVVAERTADLRREMDDRATVEARAAELREGLRQANRLATLGQVTASVAHETAQPVAAIRTYVESSGLLLDRGDAAGVRGNLNAIARLLDRIATITQELRGFARRRPGDIRAVGVLSLIEGAQLILKDQLRPVQLDCEAIDPMLEMRGGRIRLEQVIVNLMQNALEAVRDIADPRITIAARADAERIWLTVADNGPGIAPEIAGRLFTPFATSRPDGLGLGLVIAQDIMVELGGTLRLIPSAKGACFEVEAPRA